MLPSMKDLPRQTRQRRHQLCHTNDLLPSMTGRMRMMSIKFRNDDKTHMTLLAIGFASVCQKQRFHDQEMVCLRRLLLHACQDCNHPYWNICLTNLSSSSIDEPPCRSLHPLPPTLPSWYPRKEPSTHEPRNLKDCRGTVEFSADRGQRTLEEACRGMLLYLYIHYCGLYLDANNRKKLQDISSNILAIATSQNVQAREEQVR